jgi:hypothetical protein
MSWTNLKNVVSAARDIVAIGTKEVSYQASRASSATETVTNRLATKAATLKANYQESLEVRKSGLIKPEVVKETEVPTDVVSVN